jgi:hypothetical protein
MSGRTLGGLFLLELAFFGLLGCALVDRSVHQRETSLGVNQWGYRGEARAKKEPGEIRVALVGGSAAFEAGQRLSDTVPSQIFFVLQEVWSPLRQPFSVVNLSEPRTGADRYAAMLDHYAFLAPDVVVVFDGYDTPAGLPPHAREHSPVFRATGYLPVLPPRLLGRPEWMSDPDLGVAETLRDTNATDVDVSCSAASRAYCDAMAATVRGVLGREQIAIVASPPPVSARHRLQQRSLGEMLQQEFGSNPRFAFIDLGPWVDLSLPKNSPDGIHRTNLANHDVGQRIALTIVKMFAERPLSR